jgi:hypothetical protein
MLSSNASITTNLSAGHVFYHAHVQASSNGLAVFPHLLGGPALVLANLPFGSIFFSTEESEVALTEIQPRGVSKHDWMRFLMTA